METSTGFRPDQSHVPQQSRRDKLRVQQVSASSLLQSGSHHLDGHNLPNNNLEHFTLFHPDNNIINHHVRNARHAGFLYDVPSSIIPSEMLDFSRNPNNSSNSNVAVRNSVGCHDHNSEWRSSQLNPVHYQGFDWLSSTNFAGNLINPSTSDHHPLISGQVGQKYLDAMNILEDHNNIVTVASTGPRNQQDMEMSGVRDQNELALLPLSYVNRSTTARFDNADSRRHDHHHQNWNTSTRSDHEELIRSTTSTGISTRVVSDSNLQGLSLSLSSINPQLQGSSGSELDFPMNKAVKSSPGHIDPQPCSIPKPSIISKACGKSLQDIVGASSGGYRSTAGPLGPFTGYATILKSSRFLEPAQQLLDEFCGSEVLGMEGATCDLLDHNNSERGSAGEVSGSGNSGEGVNANESEVGVKKAINNNNSSCGTSSSTFYGSNEMSSGEHGGVGSSVSFGSSRPEQAQQKKAKLLYLQEEVSRKYRQYRQQMQMVVSSFESVAGLSSATPYISVALKAVSRHFRCLKNAITDQLNHTRKALGEDLPSPTTASSSKGDHAMSTVKLKYMEQSFQRHKSGGANMAFPEPQQHIWRPQRGLPERSVAILRAWLFEHFLHPYPTDTDKHMLATQTGLTRNQVSNWFINARVRVWKPMVEEIHTLETKALADQVDRGPGKHDANPASNDHTASTKLGTSTMLGKPLECPGPDYSAGSHKLIGADQQQQQQQSQDKRLRMECQLPTGMTGTLMGFVPYHRSGLEVWTRANQ